MLLVSVPGGKPMIGPVPGLSNVFLAAGHEGEGLTLVFNSFYILIDYFLWSVI